MFENKIVTFIDGNGNAYKGRVIACVKDIGITIVDDNNPQQYLYCLIMKKAPNFSKHKGAITLSRMLFTQRRKEIIAGTIDMLNTITSSEPSAATCPFGQ